MNRRELLLAGASAMAAAAVAFPRNAAQAQAPKEVTMGHIFRAVVPYVAMSLVLLVLIVLVPAVATWLPAVLG